MQMQFRWAASQRVQGRLGPVSLDSDGVAGAPARRSVLVVDDDAVQGGQLSRFLASQGIEVWLAATGEEALRRIRDDAPAVVLMDVKLPGRSGIEVAHEAALLERRPKVILMSGFPELVDAANRDGADIFAAVQKPVPLHLVLQFVRRALA